MAALDLLGRRWTLRILWELHQRPDGFRGLQARCDGMSSSVLATRLNELTSARLVEGGYRLTELGEELVEAMGPVVEWSRRWADELA